MSPQLQTRLFDKGWFILPLVLLAFFLQLGAPLLFDPYEGTFSATTWEMLQRGNFVTAYLNGEPHFDQPILIYWLQALSVSILGLNETALRLPSALAASLWVVVGWRFAKQHWGQSKAALAVLMIATSLITIIAGRLATADTLLNLMIVLSLLTLWDYHKQPELKTLSRVAIWLGLGFLCGGPVALLIPLTVSAFLFITTNRWLDWLKMIVHPVGLGIFLAIAAPWYLMEYLAHGQAFIDGFFLKPTANHASTTMRDYSGQAYHYLIALPLIILPFTLLLWPVLRHTQQLLQSTLERFLLFWFLFTLILFVFNSTQSVHYLLYGATPLILLMARYSEYFQQRWLLLLPAFLLGLSILMLPELLAISADRNFSSLNQPLWERAIQTSSSLYYRMATGIFLLVVVILMVWPRLKPLHALSAAAVIQTLIIVMIIMPVATQTQQQSVYEAARYARHYLKQQTVVMDGINKPSFTVYREHDTPHRQPAVNDYVFTELNYPEQHKDKAFTIVFKHGGLILARRTR